MVRIVCQEAAGKTCTDYEGTDARAAHCSKLHRTAYVSDRLVGIAAFRKRRCGYVPQECGYRGDCCFTRSKLVFRARYDTRIPSDVICCTSNICDLALPEEHQRAHVTHVRPIYDPAEDYLHACGGKRVLTCV